MKKVKDYSDRLCAEAGLRIIEKKEYQGIYNKNEYQIALKGKTWKIKLVNFLKVAFIASLYGDIW